ncbi:MAG: FAD-dependent oxidoreductase, partial [Chitinophagales bacterium]
IWADTAEVPQYEPLLKNIETEICVIGAGITGLTSAYLLLKEGKKVIVVDSSQVAGGESGRTTAHITSVIDDRYYIIEKLHGEKGAQLAAESEIAAINKIEEIVRSENINCDFERVKGYLFFCGEDKKKIVEAEYNACVKAGIKVEKQTTPPLLISIVLPCLEFPGQAQFHMIKYLSGLANAIVALGGKIFTHTHISNIEVKDGSVSITTEKENTIKADDVIVATNSPISNYLSMYIKEYAYRTYVIGVPVKKGTVAKGLYWDNADPYHYVRLFERETDDILIVGGEDHKTGQEHDTEKHFANLETWAKKWFPNIGIPVYKWSGQIIETVDNLSFIGLEPSQKDHVYIATGDSGIGITHGTYSAILLTDLICGRENEWAKLYDPKRKTMRSAKEFLAENLNIAAQYIELFTAGEIDDPEDITPGEGAILRKGLKKYAVYRNLDGTFNTCSALCTHLKGVVSWNGTEKTWDCPCHGSRFDAFGKVISGPAISDLEHAAEHIFLHHENK